uniref:Uncharacterized protein n=1 Tax=Anguilla anguilla TaxID=7936 RepID=A0A0E9S4Z1_ANGAN
MTKNTHVSIVYALTVTTNTQVMIVCFSRTMKNLLPKQNRMSSVP